MEQKVCNHTFQNIFLMSVDRDKMAAVSEHQGAGEKKKKECRKQSISDCAAKSLQWSLNTAVMFS